MYICNEFHHDTNSKVGHWAEFENINKKTIGIENMKVTTKHEKTDFGDIWHMSSVPKDIFRFAIYRYDDDKETIYLSNVFVDKEHRKQGLGNSILNTADKVAKKLKANTICLKVGKKHLSANGMEDTVILI